MEQENRQLDRVAPILSTEKFEYFLMNIMQTLLGVSLNDPVKSITFALYFGPPLIIILISTQVKDYMTATVISTILPVIVVVILKLIALCFKGQSQQQQSHKEGNLQKAVKLVLLTGYCYLTHNHIFNLVGFNRYDLIGISIITLVTSMCTLHSKSIKQFGMQSVEFNNVSINSSALVRPLICILILTAETIVIYQAPTTPALNILQTIYALLWLIWVGGLLASIKNTLEFTFQIINVLIFGQQEKQTFIRKFVSTILNIGIVLAIQTRSLTSNYYIITNCIIIVATFVTSTSINALMISQSEEFMIHRVNRKLEYLAEFTLVIMKVLLTIFMNANSIAINTFLAVDIAIYIICVIMIDLSKARNHIGYLTLIESAIVLKILKFMVRAAIDLSITALSCNAFAILPSSTYWNALLVRIIVYRSYKRAIYNPYCLSVHLSFLLAIIFQNYISIFYIPLLMPPLPDNFWMYFVAPFVIPKKNVHSNENILRIIYLIVTSILFFLYFFTFGFLEMTMVFGMPMFLWSIPLMTELKYSAHGKQKSIYQNLVKGLPQAVKQLEKGIYLIRISKYLTMCRVLQKGIGYQVMQFRGLESQQVTSCHNKQSQTIDNIIEETWGDNKKRWTLDFLATVLRPISKKTHFLFEENQMKLTGLIQSEEFINFFKLNFAKILLYYMKQYKFTEKNMKEMKKIKSQFSSLINQTEAKKLYPSEFAASLGIVSEVKVEQKKEEKIILPPIKIQKLPPIKKPTGKPKVFDDLDFMVQSPINISTKQVNKGQQFKKVQMASNEALFEKKVHPEQKLVQSDTESVLPQITQPCYFELIVSFYIYCLGRNKFIDQKKLYELMKSRESANTVLKSIELENKGDIAFRASRCAFKISIGKFINDQLNLATDDIAQYQQNEYIGLLEQKQFQNAITHMKKDIWALNFKDQILINRYHEREVDLYLFELEQSIVKSVWNNLRFELYYATNDDDERYSIQTHPHFLRNILIESAVEPLGYAPFYSGPVII